MLAICSAIDIIIIERNEERNKEKTISYQVIYLPVLVHGNQEKLQ